MATWRILVSGRVQGVGYRAACVFQARSLGLTGWVRNRRDGGVEALAQGDASQLGALRDWMCEGPPGARVRSCQAEPVADIAEAFPSFELRPTL